MKKARDFNGDLSPYIHGFLESLSVSDNYKWTLISHMRLLDEECLATGHSSGLLDERLVMTLYHRKDGEDLQSWKQRNCSVRKLAYYLHFLGKPAFVAPYCSAQRPPREEPPFVSDLGPWMESLVEYKRALGFKYRNERKFLKQFDAFLVSKGHIGTELTRQMVMDWGIRPEGESEKTRSNKTSIVRVLGQFMGANGGKAFVSLYTTTPEKPMPHVFSEAELKTFFNTLDTHPFVRHWMRLVYPVYYRLLYATGLREAEACCIERVNVDFESKRILVLDAKGGKDRYVYFSDDVATMLYRYDRTMDGFLPLRKWLFIGGYKQQDMLSPSSVRATFSKLWKRTGMKSHPGALGNPCTHAFRHTYVVEILAQWQNEGKDVDCLIPYLARQLGHKSINETYLYCSRLDTKFSEIEALNTSRRGILAEVRHVQY